jgi:hypothetical protein
MARTDAAGSRGTLKLASSRCRPPARPRSAPFRLMPDSMALAGSGCQGPGIHGRLTAVRAQDAGPCRSQNPQPRCNASSPEAVHLFRPLAGGLWRNEAPTACASRARACSCRRWRSGPSRPRVGWGLSRYPLSTMSAAARHHTRTSRRGTSHTPQAREAPARRKRSGPRVSPLLRS